MENVEIESMWDKKATDLTTKEQLKLVAGMTVALTVVPVAIAVGVGCVAQWWETRKTRKNASKTLELVQE